MNLRNALGFFNSVASARVLNKRVPINIMWRLTNRCNSNCKYCSIKVRRQPELNRAQIFSLISQMANCGTKRIGFVGGEALLRPDFEQIVDKVRETGIYVTLVTNGSLVPEKIALLKKLDCLVISFDGTKANHERGRGKGSFSNVMKAFVLCQKNRIKVLSNTVLNKYNLEDIDFILDTAKRYGFKCTFNLLQSSDCYPTDDSYRKALDLLIQKKKRGAPIVLSLKTMLFLRRWPDYKEFTTTTEVSGFKCWAGTLIFNIDTDGRIAACDVLSNRLKNNPSCIELGFEQAYQRVQTAQCKACTCAHVIEYNYIFSLHPSVMWDWAKLVFIER
jgi:MoaA/NifB/PqqE/SkfB family radical SAM enzyme